MSDIDDVIISIPNKGDVVIAIGNVDACKPCLKLEEFMVANAEKLGVKFVSIDMFKFREKYPKVEIIAIPKILFMRDGKVIYHYEGFSNGERFSAMVREIFSK